MASNSHDGLWDGGAAGPAARTLHHANCMFPAIFFSSGFCLHWVMRREIRFVVPAERREVVCWIFLRCVSPTILGRDGSNGIAQGRSHGECPSGSFQEQTLVAGDLSWPMKAATSPKPPMDDRIELSASGRMNLRS